VARRRLARGERQRAVSPREEGATICRSTLDELTQRTASAEKVLVF
jgi:hypothetical protein